MTGTSRSRFAPKTRWPLWKADSRRGFRQVTIGGPADGFDGGLSCRTPASYGGVEHRGLDGSRDYVVVQRRLEAEEHDALDRLVLGQDLDRVAVADRDDLRRLPVRRVEVAGAQEVRAIDVEGREQLGDGGDTFEGRRTVVVVRRDAAVVVISAAAGATSALTAAHQGGEEGCEQGQPVHEARA
jgi:hypothetical protein